MTRLRLLVGMALLLPRLVLACDPDPATSPFDGLCATSAGRCSSEPRILILSAFPAEQKVLRSMAQVTERVEYFGRSVLIGWLAGQRVILALSGIGLVNARMTTEVLAARYDVSAILFSGVAGSTHRIAEVAVPTTWFVGGTDRSYGVDPALLAAAETVAASGLVLDRCTVPANGPDMEVCMAFEPGVYVGGEGISADPFGGGAFPCQPGGDDVFGCEAHPLATPPPDSEAESVDMETAVVAEVAASRGVPFLGVRGVSDGPGDPLGLPGFPLQFFAYYRIAADNAAAVVVRLLEELTAVGEAKGRAKQLRPKASCDFERSVGADCADVSVSNRVARLVAQGCVLRTRAGEEEGARADRRTRSAALRWRRAAMLVERSGLPSCCVTTLTTRLRAAADAVEGEATLRLP